MTVIAKPIIPAVTASDAQTTQYTVPVGTRTIVDKFTATNYGASSQTISVNLVSAGGTPGDADLIVKTKTLAAGETYVFPEIVGHVLEAGGMISTLASDPASINIRASGREIT